jgi:hypothetical protein
LLMHVFKESPPKTIFNSKLSALYNFIFTSSLTTVDIIFIFQYCEKCSRSYIAVHTNFYFVNCCLFTCLPISNLIAKFSTLYFFSIGARLVKLFITEYLRYLLYYLLNHSLIHNAYCIS